METAAAFNDVVKRYGKQTVLNGVSFDIRAGEFLGLVGINGAGKTTLIKALLDLCEIQSGGIRIFDRAHTETEARAELAYLPERFVPPFFATGREFLSYLSKLYRVPMVSSEIDECLAVLDLQSEALDKPVRALSKGMAQKLGLAGVLLSHQPLLVLDEPMSGLDPKAHSRLKEHFAELHAAGQTLLFSSHNLADVADLCDRVAVLHQGRLRYCGPPAVLCAKYQTDDVEAAYIRCVDEA